MFISKTFILLFVLGLAKSSTIDCDFGKSGKKSLCSWHKTWEGMEKSNWKLAEREDGSGYYLMYKTSKRYMAKRARLVSKPVTVARGMCLSFEHIASGSKRSFPSGMPRLNVIARSLKGRRNKLWQWSSQSPKKEWQRIVLELDDVIGVLNSHEMKLEFAAIRGEKRKTRVGIDNIMISMCGRNKILPNIISKDDDKEASLSNMIHSMLPAHRVVSEIHISPENHSSIIFPDLSQPEDVEKMESITKSWRKKTKKQRRPKQRRNRNRTEKYGIVYLPEPGSVARPTGAPIQPEVLCDFIKYTHKIQRCLRTFFKDMHGRRTISERKCSTMYIEMEECLQNAAVSCVPEVEIPEREIRSLITKTMQEDLRTKEVYCEEEGAFVYPDFSFAALHLSCRPQYFVKLRQCGTSFSNMFNVEHGNPLLCRKYFTATECQRQTTAEECNFDIETMLRYGLNLQYQFAHNPFCIKLPFSAWWPDN